MPDGDESETPVFLQPAQRKDVIGSATPAAGVLLRGLEVSGAPTKDLAEAMVADFDGPHLKLSHRKGRPPKLRSRYVVLAEAGVTFSKSQAHGRGPAEGLFATADEKPWRRDQ
jgi:hypothetical protein